MYKQFRNLLRYRWCSVQTSGKIDDALEELKYILDNAPKNMHVAGDFNIDLHNENTSTIEK